MNSSDIGKPQAIENLPSPPSCAQHSIPSDNGLLESGPQTKLLPAFSALARRRPSPFAGSPPPPIQDLPSKPRPLRLDTACRHKGQEFKPPVLARLDFWSRMWDRLARSIYVTKETLYNTSTPLLKRLCRRSILLNLENPSSQRIFLKQRRRRRN